jgi:hypothetical protein
MLSVAKEIDSFVFELRRNAGRNWKKFTEITFSQGGSLMNAIQIVKIVCIYRRIYCMAKNAMSMVKGVGLGMLAGAAVAMVGERVAKTDKKHLKKNAGKAVRAVGDLIDGVEYMFK